MAFYVQLGLTFVKHAHGSGPPHYAAENDGFVFELYPASADQPASSSARIGFVVNDVDAASLLLSEVSGGRVITPAKDSPWGRRAVVSDPDGHRVELVMS